MTAAASTESAFNPFTAGIEFMQQFTKNMSTSVGLGDAAGAAAAGLGAMPNIPGMPAWAMPTMDTAELEKRINELKTVLFWLEQNTNALKASVQALEVQKMTLETLKNMTTNAQSMAAGASNATPKGARRSKAG